MRLVILTSILMTCGAGCGAAKSAESFGGDRAASPDSGTTPGRQCVAPNDCPPGQTCNQFGFCMAPSRQGDGGAGDGGAPPPPEVEVKRESPASGKRYVYVAIAAQDTVVKIDSQTLGVRTVKVGENPGALRTAPGEDLAVVLNRAAGSASILRSRADGTDEVLTLRTAAGLNQLAMAPDGRHAVAFFDVSLTQGQFGSQVTFQEVTLLRLVAGQEQAVDLSVGFNPREVQFAADGSRAYVVTDHGVSTLDLTKKLEPSIVPAIPLVRDLLTEARPAEVAITPDGKLALARIPGLKALRVVNLETRALTDLPLGAEPTDLDIAPDGALALAVLRDAKEVAFIDLPADLTDPSGVQRLSTGSYTAGQAALTPDGQRALLFTNATNQEVLLVAELKSRELRTVRLEKGVRTVLPAPDSTTALVLHNRLPGSLSPADPVEVQLDKRSGYSVLRLLDGYVKLQLTAVDPGPVAFTGDGGAAYLLLSGSAGAIRLAEAIDLRSFLTRAIPLGSPPVSVGVVPATKQVYVAQEHPLGRVTFIDTQSSSLRTLTGFALNSQVIE